MKCERTVQKFISYTALSFLVQLPILLRDSIQRRIPDEVIVDMMDSRVWDHSGLEAIHKLGARYKAAGKSIKLQHISGNCSALLKKAGSMIDVIVLPDDPSYHVANLIKSDRMPSART